MPRILDACCGSKMFWFDTSRHDTVYMDNRKLDTKLCDGRRLVIYSADEYRDMRRKVPVTLHDALADRQVSNYVQEGLTVVGNIHDAPEMLKGEPSC